jgi:cytoskeletal protein CcmA (bactofilin family)
MLEVKGKPTTNGHSASAAAPALLSADQLQNRPNVSPPNNSQQLRPSQSPVDFKDFHGKLPVITGEVHFKGTACVDGLLTGNMGSNGGMSLKQRLSASFASEPELVGVFNFKDMVRVNGHIAGSVCSKSGTIIIDTSARVDASVDVAVAVIGGTVMGDVIARERVELGPSSKIYGNIWTRSIVIKDGAIFEGVCRMIEEEKSS